MSDQQPITDETVIGRPSNAYDGCQMDMYFSDLHEPYCALLLNAKEALELIKELAECDRPTPHEVNMEFRNLRAKARDFLEATNGK